MQVPSKLRSDLVARRILDADGVAFYDVVDQKTGNSLRLYDFEWHLAQHFTQGSSWETIKQAAEKELGFAMTLEDLQTYHKNLETFHFWTENSVAEPVVKHASIVAEPFVEPTVKQAAIINDSFESAAALVQAPQENRPQQHPREQAYHVPATPPISSPITAASDPEIAFSISPDPQTCEVPKKDARVPRDFGKIIAVVGLGLCLLLLALCAYVLITAMMHHPTEG